MRRWKLLFKFIKNNLDQGLCQFMADTGLGEPQYSALSMQCSLPGVLESAEEASWPPCIASHPCLVLTKDPLFPHRRPWCRAALCSCHNTGIRWLFLRQFCYQIWVWCLHFILPPLQAWTRTFCVPGPLSSSWCAPWVSWIFAVPTPVLLWKALTWIFSLLESAGNVQETGAEWNRSLSVSFFPASLE